jgi:hypothetical protein
MEHENNSGWTTDNELDFLRQLGHHTEVNSTRGNPHFQLSRLDSLKQYKKGALLRARWGNISRDKVLSYLYDEIGRLEIERDNEINMLNKAMGFLKGA